MEIIEHYDNKEQRELIIMEWEGKRYRMLHDDFDADWKPEDEIHGTMTFTDEPEEIVPIPEPLVFTPFGSPSGVEKRLVAVEEFLQKAYPKGE